MYYMKKAFTLAEVLITLAIIGVVAAITIPSVIANAQQQEFKTGLRKAVSVLNEAIQTNVAEDGETPYETDNLLIYLKKHMSVLKENTFGTAYGDNNSGYQTWNKVFYTSDGMRFEIAVFAGSWDNYPKKYLSLHESGVSLLDRFSFISNDNTKNTYSYCGSYGLANNPHNTVNPPCVIMVDVNGDRKPNPPHAYLLPYEEYSETFGNYSMRTPYQDFNYSYPKPTDKKLTDVFNILITEDRAIPYGVVAQRAMYEK